MDKMQKLQLMDKILRELDDLKNSQTSVLKKVSQIETENINLGAGVLEKELPNLYENVDKGIEYVSALTEKFQAYRDKFSTDHKLEETTTTTTS
jgi:hypothetical protein